jgi:hypothetical protein
MPFVLAGFFFTQFLCRQKYGKAKRAKERKKKVAKIIFRIRNNVPSSLVLSLY